MAGSDWVFLKTAKKNMFSTIVLEIINKPLVIIKTLIFIQKYINFLKNRFVTALEEGFEGGKIVMQQKTLISHFVYYLHTEQNGHIRVNKELLISTPLLLADRRDSM